MFGALALGADHAGYALKEALKAYLEKREIPYHDFGCFSTDSCDYPDIAANIAQAVQKGDYIQGILCCGSGVGMCITANRFPGIRAVLCQDSYTAAISRRHNDTNVLCLGGRIVAPEYAQEIMDTFLNTPFEGGRHQRRVDKMDTVHQGDQVQC